MDPMDIPDGEAEQYERHAQSKKTAVADGAIDTMSDAGLGLFIDGIGPIPGLRQVLDLPDVGPRRSGVAAAGSVLTPAAAVPAKEAAGRREFVEAQAVRGEEASDTLDAVDEKIERGHQAQKKASEVEYGKVKQPRTGMDSLVRRTGVDEVPLNLGPETGSMRDMYSVDVDPNQEFLDALAKEMDDDTVPSPTAQRRSALQKLVDRLQPVADEAGRVLEDVDSKILTRMKQGEIVRKLGSGMGAYGLVDAIGLTPARMFMRGADEADDFGMSLRFLSLKLVDEPLQDRHLSPQAEEDLSKDPDLARELWSEGILSTGLYRKVMQAAAGMDAEQIGDRLLEEPDGTSDLDVVVEAARKRDSDDT